MEYMKKTWILLYMTPLLLPCLSQANSSLQPASPIEVPGRSGRFDFMEVDSARDRILAAHKEAGTLEILDLKSGKLLPAVHVGHVQGIAVGDGIYIAGDDDEGEVVFVNAKKLSIIGRVKVGGPVDAIAFDEKNGMVYADEDNGSHIWVIDAKNRRLVKAISIPGEPEVIAYDRRTNRIYQNIKTKDSTLA